MEIDLNMLDLKGSIESVENLHTGYAGIFVGESVTKMANKTLERCRKIDECKG